MHKSVGVCKEPKALDFPGGGAAGSCKPSDGWTGSHTRMGPLEEEQAFLTTGPSL